MELVWNRAVGRPFATLILAHGAGAGMDSAVLEQLAQGLAARGLAVVRFEFPYMAARRLDGKRRPPDPQARLLACWRDVYALVRQQVAGPVVLAGKSMGGRMAAELYQDGGDEMDAAGLIVLGYPFHPPAKPDAWRGEVLKQITTPTLLLQGERDTFGSRAELADFPFSPAVSVHWLTDGDHGFKPRKASGMSEQENLRLAAERIKGFIAAVGRS